MDISTKNYILRVSKFLIIQWCVISCISTPLLLFKFTGLEGILLGMALSLLATTISTIIVFGYDLVGRYYVYKSFGVWSLENEARRILKVNSEDIKSIFYGAQKELSKNNRFLNIKINERINTIKLNTKTTMFSRCDAVSIAFSLKDNQYTSIVMKSKPLNKYALVDDGRNSKNLFIVEKDIKNGMLQSNIEC